MDGNQGMYSWRTLRALCVLLLLLPVVHLVYLLSRDTMDLLESSPEAWNRELEVYAREDSANHLPIDPIVVVGKRGTPSFSCARFRSAYALSRRNIALFKPARRLRTSGVLRSGLFRRLFIDRALDDSASVSGFPSTASANNRISSHF